MNVHERTLAAVKNFRQPVTGPVIHSEMTQCSYALLLSCLNDLVRQGKITETRNSVDKRVFSLTEK